MGSSRHKLKAGSDDYMKAWAAQKALKEKGYAVRGRVAIAPDGTQYLDVQVWTRSDLSGVVKNQLGQGKAQNQVSNLGQKRTILYKSSPIVEGQSDGINQTFVNLFVILVLTSNKSVSFLLTKLSHSLSDTFIFQKTTLN